jgi:hypothetical protein
VCKKNCKEEKEEEEIATPSFAPWPFAEKA